MIAAMSAAALIAADGASARSGGFIGGHLSAFPNSGGWMLHRFHRFPRSAAWTGDASGYGGYAAGYDVMPYDANAFTPTYSVVPAPSAVMSRPTCHFETQTYVVPSETDGERKVSVIRCVTGAIPPPEGVIHRNAVSSTAE
jgi:hypothetical protein